MNESKPHSRWAQLVYEVTQYTGGGYPPPLAEMQRQAEQLEEQFEALQRIETAARDFLTACDDQAPDATASVPLHEFITLVEAVSGLPDTSNPASEPEDELEQEHRKIERTFGG